MTPTYNECSEASDLTELGDIKHRAILDFLEETQRFIVIGNSKIVRRTNLVAAAEFKDMYERCLNSDSNEEDSSDSSGYILRPHSWGIDKGTFLLLLESEPDTLTEDFDIEIIDVKNLEGVINDRKQAFFRYVDPKTSDYRDYMVAKLRPQDEEYPKFQALIDTLAILEVDIIEKRASK